MSAEINVFIDDGAAHVKWLLNGEIDEYDEKGNPLRKDVTANEIAAALNGLWAALEAAGRKPSAVRRGGGGNPNWKPKPPVAVKTDDGAEIEVKCPKCGGKVWDNRPKKADGSFSAKAPDFKCRDKACDTPIWSWVEYLAQQQLQDNLNRPPEANKVDPHDIPFE